MNPNRYRYDPEEAERAAIARLDAAAAKRGPVRTFADIDRERQAEGIAVASSWDSDTPFAPLPAAPPSAYQMQPSPGAAPPPPLRGGEPFVQSHVAPHMPHMPLQMPHAVQMQMPMPQMPQMPMPMPMADAEHFHANDWPPTAAPFGDQGFGGGFGGEGFGDGFGDGFGGEGFDGGGGGGGGDGFGGASFTDAAADPFAGPSMAAAAAPDPFGRFGAASEPGYRSGIELPAPPPRRPVTLRDPSGAVVELPTATTAGAAPSSSAAAAATANATAAAQRPLPPQPSAGGGASNQRAVGVTLTDPTGAPILLGDAAASPSPASPLKPSDPSSPSRPVTLTDASGAPIVVAPVQPSSGSPPLSAPTPQSPRTPGAVTLTDASGAPILPRDGADPVAAPRSSSLSPPPASLSAAPPSQRPVTLTDTSGAPILVGDAAASPLPPSPPKSEAGDP